MTPNEYQQRAHDTAIYPHERGVEYVALGLASEAGEVAGKIKKQLRDGAKWAGEQREEHRRAIAAELGDVCWYIAELCTLYNLRLEDVLSNNIGKLVSRRERKVLGGSGDNR